MPERRLPRLLIIGAMKSGTTTLYMDLADHAGVYLAENKEPHILASDRVFTEEGLRWYADLYRGARPDQLLCDASTGYTKLPDHPGVVDRALRVLPEGFRVIYIVRNPIERALSHYRHNRVAETAGPDIDAELRDNPAYIGYSRYAMQLRPWVEALGLDRVRVITFEEYVGNRSAVLADLARFLGVELTGVGGDGPKAYNQSQNKPKRNRFWDLVYHSSFYRRYCRPLVPLKLRLELFRWFLPKAANEAKPPSDATLAWLRDQLSGDAAELASMIGREPLWPELAAPPPGEAQGAPRGSATGR